MAIISYIFVHFNLKAQDKNDTMQNKKKHRGGELEGGD